MAWDKTWEEVFRNKSWGKYPPEDLVRFIAKQFSNVSLKDRDSIKLLEVGCGPGANIWFMSREGFCVYGIDGSVTAIEHAKQRLSSEGLIFDDRNLLVGDALKLPWPDNFFDAVIDCEAASCNSLEDATLLYKEMFRVTKKNGILFVKTFSVGTWGEGSGEFLGNKTWKPEEGPMANKGICRFTDESDFSSLFYRWTIEYTEMITRELFDNNRNLIKEWIVHARKK